MLEAEQDLIAVLKRNHHQQRQQAQQQQQEEEETSHQQLYYLQQVRDAIAVAIVNPVGKRWTVVIYHIRS
jgi:hypothetical protein